MADGTRHPTRYRVEDSEPGFSGAPPPSTSRNMTPLEKVLAAEPRSGNWKVVHDGKRSEYRINGNCIKCISKTITEKLRDPRQFRLQTEVRLRIVNYNNQRKEHISHFAVSLLDIHPHVSEKELNDLIGEIFPKVKLSNEIDIYRTPAPYDMACIELPSKDVMEICYTEIVKRCSNVTINPPSIVKDPFCLKLAKRHFKHNGLIIQPTRRLSSCIDSLYEIHRKMDPNLQLPPDYYEKMKLELNQKRAEEKRLYEQQPSTSEKVDERPPETQRKDIKQEVSVDIRPVKKPEIDGDKFADGRKYVEKDSSRYEEKSRPRWEESQRRERDNEHRNLSTPSTSSSDDRRHSYRRSPPSYRHRSHYSRHRHDRSRTPSPRRYNRHDHHDRRDRELEFRKVENANDLITSRKLDPVERLRRLHMPSESRESSKVEPVKQETKKMEPKTEPVKRNTSVIPSMVPPVPAMPSYPFLYHNFNPAEFGYSIPPPPFLMGPPPPPEKTVDEKEVAYNNLLNSVTNDLKTRIRQSLEIMFRNQVSNEAKERARRHVEAERRAKAARQAQLKAARKPSPKRNIPTAYDFSQKTLDISQCGRIPKKENYSKSSGSRRPSRYSREHSPVSSASSSSTTRSSSPDSSTASSREVSRSSSRSESRLQDDSPSAIEVLKDHMNEIDKMQAAYDLEEKYIAKLEKELRFLKSDKSTSGKDHRRRVNDKIERANTNLLEKKKKLTSLVMKLPALRNEAAIENSEEWQELLENEAAEKMKADKEAKKQAEAKAAAEKREAKQAERRAKEMEKAFKTIENRQKKEDEEHRKESVSSDEEGSEDLSDDDSSEAESIVRRVHLSAESSGSEGDMEIDEKPLELNRKRKLSESEFSSSESSSEYNPSDASPPRHAKRGLKRKRSTSLDHKENVPRTVKKMKSIPQKTAEPYIKTEKMFESPVEHPEEEKTTTLNQYYFGYDVKPLKHRERINLLSREFWEDADREQDYESEEPRDFFVIPEPPVKPGVGARVRYDRRTPLEEYCLTMSMTQQPFDEEEIMYMELAFAKVVKKKELPFSHCFKWRNPAYLPDPEEYPEPILENDVLEHYTDPDLHLITPSLTGSIRTHGLFRYTRMEKVARRRLTVPARLEITDDDRQMVKNYQQQYRTENTLLRQLRTAGLEGVSLLQSNALTSRPICVTFAPSRIHDWGLFTLEDIKPRSMIIEYIGEICRSTIVDEREQRYLRSGIGSSYLFRIDRNWVIDATKMGNCARFINHSCTPNSYARVVKGMHIAIYSKRFIEAGEEITYDYKFPVEDTKIPCYCNSANCRGSLN